jgi:L-lactate dehydrogenase complex protein LldE
MKAGLMILCYVDMFYPEVGIATVELLEKLRIDFEYPFDQTCCGQPMADSRCYEQAKATDELFVRLFHDYEYIIGPSGSCTHHIRSEFTAAAPTPERETVSKKVVDLVEFLHDVLKVDKFPWAHFPFKVALYTSCSAILGLGMASMSELVHRKPFSEPKALPERVDGLQFVEFDRHDPHFRNKAYAGLMTGPSGSADIGGKTVHPAQGVMTSTVIYWPRGNRNSGSM